MAWAGIFDDNPRPPSNKPAKTLKERAKPILKLLLFIIIVWAVAWWVLN